VRLQRYPDAIGDLEKLLDRAVRFERDSVVQSALTSNDFRYALALLYQRSGQPDSAWTLYREVLVNDLGLYMAHVHLAELAEERQDWKTALRERREALDLNGDDPTSMLEWGFTLAKSGALAQGDSVLRDAASRCPRDARIPYYQGLVAQARHDSVAARAAFERFLVLAPSRYTKQIADARRRLDAIR
jgi:tetratricopeptide (TPR) repeat protein